LAFFAFSLFNAYEARYIGVWPYFLAGVASFTLPLALLASLHDFLSARAGRAAGLLGWRFLASSALCAAAVSYAVSAVVWLRSGAPSIGTSIYAEYILLASIYVAARIERSAETRLWRAAAVLAIISLSGVLAFYITPNTLPHALGLLLSIAVIYARHTRLAAR
jgi:cation transport ATPase